MYDLIWLLLQFKIRGYIQIFSYYFRQIGAGLPLRGHSGPIQAVSVLPREELVVSASHDNTMRAWRLTDYSCAAIYRLFKYVSLEYTG